jgi:hypothetical protein
MWVSSLENKIFRDVYMAVILMMLRGVITIDQVIEWKFDISLL